jgi:CHAD domain-containing protein
VAKARPIPGLSDQDAFAAAAAKVIAVRAAELAEHSTGVLEVSDIERVHDMRVATRRLRAAMEVFEACFAKQRFKRTLKEVKALADALGERRDRDVTIAELRRFAEAIGRADRPGVQSLILRIREEQGEANRELEAYVSEERLAGLAERLALLVDDANGLVSDEPPMVAAGSEAEPGPPPQAAAPASLASNGGRVS